MSPSLKAINATNPHAARKTKNSSRHIISVQLCFLRGPFQFTTSIWSAGGVPDEFPRPIASSGLCFVYFKTSFVISITTMNRKCAIVYTSINVYIIIPRYCLELTRYRMINIQKLCFLIGIYAKHTLILFSDLFYIVAELYHNTWQNMFPPRITVWYWTCPPFCLNKRPLCK